MSVIDNIVFLLKEQHKSQKELCDHLGITKNAFTDWKAGRIKSYTKHLPQIADFFGVSVDYLLGKEDKNKKSPSGIPEELLEALASDPVKLELARIICSWDSDKVDRAMQLLSASLLLPKEDPKP